MYTAFMLYRGVFDFGWSTYIYADIYCARIRSTCIHAYVHIYALLLSIYSTVSGMTSILIIVQSKRASGGRKCGCHCVEREIGAHHTPCFGKRRQRKEYKINPVFRREWHLAGKHAVIRDIHVNDGTSNAVSRRDRLHERIYKIII